MSAIETEYKAFVGDDWVDSASGDQRRDLASYPENTRTKLQPL